MAVHNDLLTEVEFFHSLRQLVERDQVAAKVADAKFIRVTDIKDERGLASVETMFEFFDGDLQGILIERLIDGRLLEKSEVKLPDLVKSRRLDGQTLGHELHKLSP